MFAGPAATIINAINIDRFRTRLLRQKGGSERRVACSKQEIEIKLPEAQLAEQEGKGAAFRVGRVPFSPPQTI